VEKASDICPGWRESDQCRIFRTNFTDSCENKWNQTTHRFLFRFPSLTETNSMSAALHTVTFPNGSAVPALGQGTWHMGEAEKERAAEIKALQLGLDLGMTLIDTAEMYSDGEAEKIVGQAISGRRADVHLVSKVYPHNASRKGAVAACERSLRRLKTDYLDLYLLHWRGSIPLQETLSAFGDLRRTGKIRNFGVSNFDKSDMEQIMELPGGGGTATNQVLYNLQRRGIEWDLLPWCRQRRIPIMAYSPIEQGRLLTSLRPFAERRGLSPAQVALAWVLSQEGIIAIPKASNVQHVSENRAAAEIVLSEEDLTELDALYPRPARKVPLEML
jgi:diketogulonate reductase-like aldo/keto reductase